MANHKVTAGGGMKATAPSPAPKKNGDAETAYYDPSRFRPLSEGVLRAVGMHGGHADGEVIDKRGHLHEDAGDIDAYALPSDELHVRLAQLMQDVGGYMERDVNVDGSVTLRMTYGDGDVTVSKAATTPEAAEALIVKMGGTK